jgi:hydrogenase maturation protease
MKQELVEKIADAVLYEGYILYPYRPSAVKNRQRFNFGVLTPQSYSEAQHGTENWRSHTEVLLIGNQQTTVDVKLRFLQLREREVRQFDAATAEYRVVEVLEVGGQLWQTWQEAVERDVEVKDIRLSETIAHRIEFTFPSLAESEILRDASGNDVGSLVRIQKSIHGIIEIHSKVMPAESAKLETNHQQLFKLTIDVCNTTAFADAERKTRDEALLHSLASAHTILSVQDGEFVSLLEPPDEFSAAVASCQNVSTFPVLVGEQGERNCMLSSPIILYDYPQIAPESAGELFDGTEIDEILTLRIMTMTEEEKREMRNVDERARQILERTENMSLEQMMRLHGVLRQPRALGEWKP